MTPFEPSQWPGCPLDDLVRRLRDRPAEEVWGDQQGQVTWHAPAAELTLDLLTAQLNATTDPAADLPADHPEIDLPGVILEQLLGEGGQGWVYAGRVVATGHLVAVKVLRGNGGWAAHEAAICQRFRHRQLLRVFRAEPVGPGWVVVMELIRGRPLSEAGPYIDLPDTFRRLAAGLRMLASGCVVHRDVKPANILLRTADDSPVLIDFGLAVDCAAKDRPPAVMSGTPLYMAPEAFRSDAQAEPSWDAYGLGVTLIEALTGALPNTIGLGALRRDKLNGTFDQMLRQRLRQIDDNALRDWAGRLIHRDVEERYQALLAR
jgi:serine/threonine protein kinase